MGDIHGAHKALVQCLDRCEFDPNFDTLIQLGDVVDGWSDVYNTIEQLLKIKNLVQLMGNHDEWFLHYLYTGLHPVKWNQGGKATAVSYLRECKRDHLIRFNGDGWLTGLNPGDIPDTHKKFFEKMLYRYELRTESAYNCFVHGGFNINELIEYQHNSIFLWDRELWKNAKNYKKGVSIPNFNDFTDIFIGHTHIDGGYNTECLPLEFGRIYNLDTGAGWSGKLTIMDVNTKKYWQSDYVNKLYPDEFGRR